MPPSYDLHTHSTASDGSYPPAELVRQAALAGITHLALTDHDSLAGLEEASRAASANGIRLIPGVEISVLWHGKSIHIVGLGIDPGEESLREGLAGLQAKRITRAEEMGRRLAKHGIEGAFEAARDMAGAGMITRSHFARYLVQLGLAPTVKDVFDRYLVQGKPGYVPTQWASLEDAVGWIGAAGGVAVIAHPQRYRLTGSWMHRLLNDFKACGGGGLEVISGTGGPGDVQAAAARAKRFELLASAGSDFHSPDFLWPKLGRLDQIPQGLIPVWDNWEA